MKPDHDQRITMILDGWVQSYSPRGIRQSRSRGQALWRTLLFVLLLPTICVWSLIRLVAPPTS